MAEHQARFDMLIARKKNGWTQTQLADRLGVTRNWIAAIERGEHKPGYELALKLAKVLKVDESEFFQSK